MAQATRAWWSRRNLVRGRSRAPPLSELMLLAAHSDPRGRRPIAERRFRREAPQLGRRMPPLLRPDGTEFDKARVIPYAYRHTYAQRHADAGVPVDVLAHLLMDHRSLDTTRGYYSVGEPRRREAVDKVTALQFDRHGNRIWRDAKALLDSEHARRAIGEVAVPYGTCSEPCNVQAGGTPARSGSAVSAAATSAPTSPTCPTCTPTSTTCSATGNACSPRPTSISGRGPRPYPPQEEITRIRRLITRIEDGLEDLTAAEREQTSQAVNIVRRHRAVALGMPRHAAGPARYPPGTHRMTAPAPPARPPFADVRPTPPEGGTVSQRPSAPRPPPAHGNSLQQHRPRGRASIGPFSTGTAT